MGSIANDIINFLPLDAKSRIQQGINDGFDINGLPFAPNSPGYIPFKRDQNSPVLWESGNLYHSIDTDFASVSRKSAFVGSNLSYGEDHFEERRGYGNRKIPIRLWFYDTDNLGGESSRFLSQYGTVIKEFNLVSRKNFFPNFLKKLKTNFRII